MYNLIVTANPEAWNGRRYELDISRFGEYTAEPLKVRYRTLGKQEIIELLSFPTLFSYEQLHGLPARIGRVTRISEGSRGTIRFEFEFFKGIQPLPAEMLAKIAWDLDIVDWELNRTHWAVKDVDLIEVLREAGLVQADFASFLGSEQQKAGSATRAQLIITPTVFAVPAVERDPKLVALMMPFSSDFELVAETIRRACQNAGLKCERVDDVWEESTIIQEVFNLIFRSSVVVVDLSGRNSNVMYETGIAHTLGRTVVPISQAGANLPFDLAHHRTLVYLANKQGLDEMKTKLERRLRSLTV